jgi:hypothetical protein
MQENVRSRKDKVDLNANICRYIALKNLMSENKRGGSLLFIYRNNPHTVEELKDEITTVVENISKETQVGVMENFSLCPQIILDAQGSHVEYLFP